MNNRAKKENSSSQKKEKESAWQKFMTAAANVKPRQGSWLRQWRLDHHMSQVVLAALLKVSVRTLIRWERLEQLPRLVVMALEGK